MVAPGDECLLTNNTRPYHHYGRELEKAAMQSLEVAEQRRSEWEDKASKAAARLRERDAEVGTGVLRCLALQCATPVNTLLFLAGLEFFGCVVHCFQYDIGRVIIFF